MMQTSMHGIKNATFHSTGGPDIPSGSYGYLGWLELTDPQGNTVIVHIHGDESNRGLVELAGALGAAIAAPHTKMKP